MPRQTETKQKIIENALNLFSKMGFEAVSTRDIAKAVGIGNSALYKHFTSKSEIFEEIVKTAKEELNRFYNQLNIPMPESALEDVSKEKFWEDLGAEKAAEICAQMTLLYAKDPFISKFRKLLCIERYSNPEMDEIFTEFFIQRPLRNNERTFDYLLKNDVVEGASARQMSLEYFSPCFLIQELYANQPDKMEEELKAFNTKYLVSHLKKN